MVLQHILGLFAQPDQEWRAIRDEHPTISKCYCSHVLLLAAIPAAAGFIGTTQVGWDIGGRIFTLTTSSALTIAAAAYIAMLLAVFLIGKTIHWMGQTYGASQPLPQCIALAAYSATPLWLIGVMWLYPDLAFNLVVGLPALAYSVYLLYMGIPIVMSIPEERGFLFSSAVLAVVLISLVAVLAISTILWLSGFGPENVPPV